MTTLQAGEHADQFPLTERQAAAVQQAKAALDRLEHPATTGQIAAAEAQVHSAQAELDLLTARHANPDEMVQPGQSVLTLADLGSLRVETTDLGVGHPPNYGRRAR